VQHAQQLAVPPDHVVRARKGRRAHARGAVVHAAQL
jgi:hypothetical protein